MKSKGLNIKWLAIVFASLVIAAFVAVDNTILGRLLYSTKSERREYFAESGDSSTDSPKLPYTHVTSTALVAPEDMVRNVSVTNSVEQCKDSCSYDDNCVAYSFNKVKQNCALMYDVNGFVDNKADLFNISGGIKHRPFIGPHVADKKVLRYEGMELPAGEGSGKIATHQFIKSVDDCYTKCLELNDNSVEGGKCIAFEYDFKTKACTLNSVVNGKFRAAPNKDVYVRAN